MIEKVVLVDEWDNPIGEEEKLKAHSDGGKLHRAISVFIFNSNNEVLLQQRASTKYHSPLLWTNTCCSHPRPHETTIEAANRRLDEEMGLKTDLKFLFSFIYKVDFENQLTEHEFDHVFIGSSDDTPLINKSEVHDYKYIAPNEIERLLVEHPHQFTEWFKICWNEMRAKANI